MYTADSDSYLARAKSCLEKSEAAFRFYAAFELRCYVEQRQHELLLAQERYRRSLPKKFELAKQHRELNRIFGRNEIQSITSTFADGWTIEFRYVPVSSFLKRRAQRLDQFRHALSEDMDDSMLGEFHGFLTSTTKMADECASGNMLSPALMSKEGVIGDIQVKLGSEDPVEMKRRFVAGTQVNLSVRYLPFECVE